MVRLSTPTRSPIGSPARLNCHSNTIPDRLSCMTQLSKADSSSSTASDKHAIQAVQDSQHQSEDGRERGVHLLEGVNLCILLAWGNVFPMLSLFSRLINDSKWVIATLQSATTKPKS
ncbi:hypothetical protein CDL15_Pgr012804 [Punica granatum]|uniref:Uncharacterized protein n=1 Tax=Punica granatum TaxID=22663 RepID=A0A218XEG1_PUNGR|nr:hypothetical protein CDL15_Pgr012804 [Punica granatum]